MPVIPSPAVKPVSQEADFAEAPLAPADVTAPSTTLKDRGYQTGETLASNNLNWFFRTIGRWIAYLRDFEILPHTWAVDQYFSANAIVTDFNDNTTTISPTSSPSSALLKVLADGGGMAISASGAAGSEFLGGSASSSAVSVKSYNNISREALGVTGSDGVGAGAVSGKAGLVVRGGSALQTSGGAVSTNVNSAPGEAIIVPAVNRAPNTKFSSAVVVGSLWDPALDINHPGQTDKHAIEIKDMGSVGFTGFQSNVDSSVVLGNIILPANTVAACGTYSKVSGTAAPNGVSSAAGGLNCVFTRNAFGRLVVTFPKPLASANYQLLVQADTGAGSNTVLSGSPSFETVLVSVTQGTKTVNGFTCEIYKHTTIVSPWGGLTSTEYLTEKFDLNSPDVLLENLNFYFVALGVK